MNLLQKTTRQIIKKLFQIAVATIEHFSDMQPYHNRVAKLRELEDGTLGKEIANCLDAHNLMLVPQFESHDLKHTLLDYKMTAEDEIRLQAFMIGNGNYTMPTFVIFLFGFLLLPDMWTTFYKDFKKGQETIPISTWTIEELANTNLEILQSSLKKSINKKDSFVTRSQLTQLASYTVILAGVLGMLFCLPFLFSSNIADLVGAGFPFVGGAILVAGGLISLSNQAKTTNNSIQVF